MLVGLMGDTHDRLPAIRELLKEMIQRGVGMAKRFSDPQTFLRAHAPSS